MIEMSRTLSSNCHQLNVTQLHLLNTTNSIKVGTVLWQLDDRVRDISMMKFELRREGMI